MIGDFGVKEDWRFEDYEIERGVKGFTKGMIMD